MIVRWFFLLLLVLNLFYYVWHQQQAPLRVKAVPPLESYQADKRDIQLLSEMGVTGSEVPPVARVDAETVCLLLGDFEREDEARVVEQRLMSLDIRASLREIDASAGVDYWVYLPPLGSRQASLRQLKELQARHIDSYIITEGDLGNGISLGIFPRKESADNVVVRLREAGYEPLLRELERAHRSYWVQILPEGRRLVGDELLSRLSVDFPGLQHRLMPCEGVASAQ